MSYEAELACKTLVSLPFARREYLPLVQALSKRLREDGVDSRVARAARAVSEAMEQNAIVRVNGKLYSREQFGRMMHGDFRP